MRQPDEIIIDGVSLAEIIRLHELWLKDDPEGKRAYLQRADLQRAYLQRADLRYADLQDASLSGAKNIPDYVVASTNILPEGEIILWKKLSDDKIAKLLVPSEAKRSNATGRKCRVEYAKVLEIWDEDKQVEEGKSQYDDEFIYRVGEIVKPDKWDDDRWNECSNGIHGFITRYEAENY